MREADRGIPDIRFARTEDGVTIAYQIFGQGPPLVWMPSLSNIVAQWRVPALRRAYEELARHVTLVLYDGRGTGGSDRRVDTGDLGIDAHVRDVTGVLDAVGLSQTPLLGDVRAPALVLHRQADEQIPVEVARRLADGLPHGRLLELPGTTPTLFIEDAASDLRLVSDFVLTGRVARTPVRTVLTPRERDVLKLPAAGESNGEIAKRLGITVHTVERHSANLYRKIGARGRSEAAAYAVRHGLA